MRLSEQTKHIAEELSVQQNKEGRNEQHGITHCVDKYSDTTSDLSESVKISDRWNDADDTTVSWPRCISTMFHVLCMCCIIFCDAKCDIL